MFDDELLRQYKDADAIFMCLSDQKEGRDRAASVAERLGKTVILAGLEPGILRVDEQVPGCGRTVASGGSLKNNIF